MGLLSGIRVVEFGGIGPGPFCAMMLADRGADVVRVDRPDRAQTVSERFLHRNRRIVTLDLKSVRGRAAAIELVRLADVLIEGFRPGVMERLGLGPERCMELNPGLVYGRMTGWGQDGPMAQRAGHDINYLALSGALHAVGEENGPPVPPLNLVGDFGGGAMLLAFGIVTALLNRALTGAGRVVEAAIVDGVSLQLGMFHALLAAGSWQDRRGANTLDGGAPFYAVYRCRDGGYVAVGAIEPEFYDRLVQGLGLDARELGDRGDRSDWPRIRARFAEVFATRTRDEWAALFSRTDACVTPVLSLEEAPHHAHSRARGSFGFDGKTAVPLPAPRFGIGEPQPGLRPGGECADPSDVIADWTEQCRP